MTGDPLSESTPPDVPAFLVGLTGGIGSGKSTVADLFAARGTAVVDTDVIAHQLTSAAGRAMAPIRAAFGDHVLTADGALDRAAMRAWVFSNPDARHILESILHPMIRKECEQAIRQATGPYHIVVVPLLVETGEWRARVQRVLVVDCEEEEQIRRVMQRNRLSRDQVLAIMAAQASRAQRLAAADDVILNGQGRQAAALVPEVDRLHALYQTLGSVGGRKNLQ